MTNSQAAEKDAPFRIALMLPRLSRYGGVEQFGWHFAQALARKGHMVEFICARQEGTPPEGVRVRRVGRPPGLRFMKMLWFLIRAERIRKSGDYDVCVSLGKTWKQDIFRAGGGPLRGFWKLSQQAWEPGLPRLLKKCSRLLQPANWLILFLERRIYRQTPHLVAISDAVGKWVLEAYPHLSDPESQQRLHTIYNCPDLSRYHAPTSAQREAARAGLGVEAGRYAIGIATTNFVLKGLAPLIRSLPLLEADTHLHVAGGRKSRRYERLAVALGLEGRVHFHGKLKDMRGFYHALDMFVLPSFYDTLANVVLEAMSSGVKTLCSDRAGACAFLPGDQIIDEPSDPVALAGKIRALRAKEEIVPFVSKGAGIDDLVALVEQVAEQKRGGA
ncbi:glycosyltransferase family 4 protein [Desulfovibrio sp. OttesenSCG-928-A18]|nr:glycosyltransferase family 4 protein [Desulfovibrio sp. OttesenSCG-928-A18]